MAVQYIEFKSPQGREMVKTKSGGEDRPEDAGEMARLFGAGGRYEGRGLLIVTDPKMALTADTRKAYAEARRASPVTTAMVVQSAASRVAINFVIRAADSLKKSEKEARCFGTEDEAIAWLDEQQAAGR